MTGTDECEFVLQVIDAGGEAGETLFFGVVDTVPSGFGHLPIGHPHLQSVGIAACPSCGAVVHGGRILGEVPGVKSGDTVKVLSLQGRNSLLQGEAQKLEPRQWCQGQAYASQAVS